jgi:Ca2+-binding RTX toxin-like protein
MVTCLVLISATGAGASTVTETVGHSCDPFSFAGYCLNYEASAGETNSVTATRAANGASTLADPGALILPGIPSGGGALPCVALIHNASCLGIHLASSPASLLGLIGSWQPAVFSVTLGDGNDSARAIPGAEFLAKGGPGADRLDGSAGTFSYLIGGSGTDTMIGPATADYGDHTVGVNVTLDGVANDGAPGENDTLIAVESVIGGSGNDTLVGDASINGLAGRGGVNTIIGGSGNDILSGFGTDLLDGGDGADLLEEGGPGADHVNGASGADTIFANSPGSTLEGGTGNDSIQGLGAGSVIDGGDGDDGISTAVVVPQAGLLPSAQTVVCGAGNDSVTADSLDTVSPDCEHVTIVP